MEDCGRETDQWILDKMKNIYASTVAAVRVRERLTRSFEINKGVRQECVLSPTLFRVFVHCGFR